MAAEVPGARAVVVQGRYEHVNFVVDPDPLRVVVREVVPPHPAKLADQARRIVDVTEALRPLRLESEVVDLADLARRLPAEHYLLPCRGGGSEIPGATMSYLDERPGARRLDPRRLRALPPDPPVVLRPRRAAGRLLPEGRPGRRRPGSPADQVLPAAGGARRGCRRGSGRADVWVSVPWGASLEHVREALGRLAELAETQGAAPWSPA